MKTRAHELGTGALRVVGRPVDEGNGTSDERSCLGWKTSAFAKGILNVKNQTQLKPKTGPACLGDKKGRAAMVVANGKPCPQTKDLLH